MRVLAIAAGSLLAFSGCDVLSTEAASALEAIHVQTGTHHYRRPSAELPVPVSFVIENHGTRTVAIQRCGERVMAALDRKEEGGWTQHSGDACPANQTMIPLELAPGGRTGSAQWVREPGIYRLRLGVDRGVPQVMWSVTSNEFVVE